MLVSTASFSNVHKKEEIVIFFLFFFSSTASLLYFTSLLSADHFSVGNWLVQVASGLLRLNVELIDQVFLKSMLPLHADCITGEKYSLGPVILIASPILMYLMRAVQIVQLCVSLWSCLL